MVAEELARGWMSVASLIARGNSFYRVVPGTGEARRGKILAMAQGRYLGRDGALRAANRLGPVQRRLPRPA